MFPESNFGPRESTGQESEEHQMPSFPIEHGDIAFSDAPIIECHECH